MKKLFIITIILLILYLGLSLLFKVLDRGNNDNYELRDSGLIFNIKEQSYFKDKINNYSYEIEINNKVFKFQIFHNFYKQNKIIEKIKYYKDDNYECILPIFKNDLILVDMMCLNNDIITYYHDIKDNEQLTEFIKTIDEYDIKLNNDNYQIINNLKVYKNNLLDNHYIGITNYKGIYNISSKFNSTVYNISLFNKDTYNQKLGVFVNGYYVVADYDDNYTFDKLNIVDLINLKIDQILVDNISFDSYIQGVVDNKIYLYDKDEKVQYEIDIDKKSINKNRVIKYYNKGVWLELSIIDADNEVKFIYDENKYENHKYVKIDKYGIDVGYYYLYKKNGNKYDVYKTDLNLENQITYLFSTETIDTVYYLDNYIYFINKNQIQVFNDVFGVKTLVEYDELEFNKLINFNVYVK